MVVDTDRRRVGLLNVDAARYFFVAGADGVEVRSFPGQDPEARRERRTVFPILSESTILRVSVDLSGGVGIAAASRVVIVDGSSIFPAVGGGLVLAVLVWGAMCGVGLFLQRLMAVTQGLSTQGSSPLQWFLAATRGESPRGRRALLIALIVAWASPVFGVVWGVGPGAVWAGVTDVFIAALPAVFLLVLGIWGCLLTQRRVRASRYRWVRYSVDVLVAVLTGLELLVLLDRDLLAIEPAAGLLFPVGAWFSIRTWRVMVDSRRPEVRAGADIALSLLLGADLVLFLVWGANVLDLPKAELVVLRGTLERAGSIADLPWSLWVGVYVLLAGTSLAIAFWPEKLTAITRWSQRLRVVSSIDVSRRMLTGVHISLLVTVLIGLTAPAALEAALRGPLKAKYTVELQRELESHGEQTAYEEIRRRFTADTRTSPSVQPLVAMVSKIHSISSPPPGTSDATSTERDDARRLGQIQATTLQFTVTQSVLSTQQVLTDLAQFDPPIRDEGDLNDRLDRFDAQQEQTDTATRQVNQAAELAATAVANMIQIPGLGENEIIQVIREYLSGLVENSPLKKVFAAWAEHLTGATTPPSADTMVVPDPEQLEQVALDALTQEKARGQLVDLSTPDPAQTRAQTEPPTDAAVDLINETRYLDEDTGPCDGCSQPHRPGDNHHQGPGDDPVEPEEPHFVIPE